MQIELISRDYNITESMRQHIEDKLGFIANFTDDKVLITLSKSGDDHKIKVLYSMNNKPINICEIHPDFYDGVNVLKETLFTQLTKRKEILVDQKRKETRSMKKFNQINKKMEERYGYEDYNSSIADTGFIKQKIVPIKPMLIEEAALQMNVLNYRFLAFINGETMEENIIYLNEEDKYRLLVLKSESEHSQGNLNKLDVPEFISKVKSVPLYELREDEAFEELTDHEFPFYPYYDVDEEEIKIMYENNKNKSYCSMKLILS